VGRRCIDSRTCDATCQKSVEESIVALSACIEQHGERRIVGAGVTSAHCGVDSRPEERAGQAPAMGWTKQVQKKQCSSD
jgi:hypothetical protein